MKNILFITPSIKNGGAELMLSYVANLFSKNNLVFVYAMEYGKNEVVYNKNICCIESKIKGSKKKGFFKRIKEIKSIINEKKITHIVAFTPKCMKAAILAKTKEIFVVSSERDNPYNKSKLKRYIDNFFYKRCDKVVFQTEGAFKAFKNVNGIIISNPSKFKIDNNTIGNVFVCSQRLVKNKRVDIIISAFNEICKKYSDYYLHIYGKGEEEANLQQLVKKYGIEDKVVFKGWVNDWYKLETNVRAFILASETEGMPNVLIEAMSSGFFSISSNSRPGGPYELLENGKNGLLFEVNDLNGLIRSLIYSIENTDKCKEIIVNAYKRMDSISSKKIDDLWLSIFD